MAQLLSYLKDTPEVQGDDFVETFPYYESAGELQETMEYLLQLRLLLKEDDERLYELISNETDFRESLEFAEVGNYATFFTLVASDLELALYTNYLTKIYQAVREQQISSAIPDFAEFPIVTQRLIQKMDAGILSQQALRMMNLALARLEPEISEALAENIERYLAFSDKENILEIIDAMDEEELSQALDAMSDDDVADILTAMIDDLSNEEYGMYNYIFKIYPKGFGRQVYRIIQMAGNQSLEDLLVTFLDSMKFDFTHLYRFEVDGLSYERSEEYMDVLSELGSETTLDSLVLEENEVFEAVYDFGDNWRFVFKVQKMEEIKDEQDYWPTKVLKETGYIEQYPND
ncbi:IS1096 element passenger TnpR family protein [Enterococcus cecorum]|uniref:IS1096 element passenger TnpR family protein n=1 Tax=Enterococcus cecorum TaxID=44008 RepID=UPI002ACAE9FB|nr:hypothetical protein [Enterococcus cecorum]MDZ5589171.1 hypothetical protein [Enterococcus cecorum]